ncbi:MAG TPA: AsmA family protein, partial [Candidatus Acidoferrum sp.]|nr:AsmA family protein [Candidatus Acidoferrum sp.]
MGRTLKIIGIVIVVLILIVVIAPFLIPVNSFRPQIEQQASAALGRKVEIGNLSLSLFSGSLGADNLSIADDPKFSSAPFLTAKSFNVGVEVMPLITSKTLNVTSVVIDGPQVSLIRNAAGDWNYSTLGVSPTKAQSQAAPAPSAGQAAKPSAPASAPPAGAPPAFTIQKLELKNGQITVSSVGSAKKSSYSNLNVTASNVS